MLILLNGESVIYECLTMAKVRLSGVLGIPPDWVIVQIVPRDGRLFPEVELAIPDDGAEQHPRANLFRQSRELTVERIGQVMAQVKADLLSRLEGIQKVL